MDLIEALKYPWFDDARYPPNSTELWIKSPEMDAVYDISWF
jgi:hypothetical protein